MQSLLELAFRFGPFFFSLYVFQKVMRWAYQKYHETLVHDPPLDKVDIRTQRLVWVASFIAGFVLVGISVWWWLFFYNERTYFFVGHIRNLHDYERLDSDDLYFHAKLKYYFAGGILRNEDFLFVQTKPFKQGQTFDLLYSKSGADQTQLTIAYDPLNSEPTYEIDFDGKKNKLTPVVQSVGSPKPDVAWLSPSVVHAQEPLSEAGDSAKPEFKMSTKSQSPQDTELKYATSALEKENTPVPAKIDAIKKLQSSDPNKVRSLLGYGDEPLALTLFDLTRHSDDELAYRASEESKELDIDDFLIEELSSPELAKRQQAEQILMRISRTHALAVLSKVKTTSPDLVQTKSKIRAGESTVLQATGTSRGDRYYVLATWDPSQSSTVSCLTMLFNKELEGSRTLDQEKEIMSRKPSRLVYWYSKSWAIWMASRIKTCGGSAQFVKLSDFAGS